MSDPILNNNYAKTIFIEKENKENFKLKNENKEEFVFLKNNTQNKELDIKFNETKNLNSKRIEVIKNKESENYKQSFEKFRSLIVINAEEEKIMETVVSLDQFELKKRNTKVKEEINKGADPKALIDVMCNSSSLHFNSTKTKNNELINFAIAKIRENRANNNITEDFSLCECKLPLLAKEIENAINSKEEKIIPINLFNQSSFADTINNILSEKADFSEEIQNLLKDIQKLNKEGNCGGLSPIVSYALNCDHNKIPGENINSEHLFDLIKTICSLNENQKNSEVLTESVVKKLKSLNLKRILHLVNVFQGGGPPKIGNCIVNSLENKRDQNMFKRDYSTCFVVKNSNELKDKLEMILENKKDKLINLYFTFHATSISKQGDKYCFYDPNNNEGIFVGNLDEVCKEIIQSKQKIKNSREVGDSGLHVFSTLIYSSSKTEDTSKYPEKEKIFELSKCPNEQELNIRLLESSAMIRDNETMKEILNSDRDFKKEDVETALILLLENYPFDFSKPLPDKFEKIFPPKKQDNLLTKFLLLYAKKEAIDFFADRYYAAFFSSVIKFIDNDNNKLDKKEIVDVLINNKNFDLPKYQDLHKTLLKTGFQYSKIDEIILLLDNKKFFERCDSSDFKYIITGLIINKNKSEANNLINNEEILKKISESDFKSILESCIDNGDNEFTKLILDKKSNINFESVFSFEVCKNALKTYNEEALKLIMQKDILKNFKQNEIQELLEFTAEEKNNEFNKYFLDKIDFANIEEDIVNKCIKIGNKNILGKILKNESLDSNKESKKLFIKRLAYSIKLENMDSLKTILEFKPNKMNLKKDDRDLLIEKILKNKKIFSSIFSDTNHPLFSLKFKDDKTILNSIAELLIKKANGKIKYGIYTGKFSCKKILGWSKTIIDSPRFENLNQETRKKLEETSKILIKKQEEN